MLTTEVWEYKIYIIQFTIEISNLARYKKGSFHHKTYGNVKFKNNFIKTNQDTGKQLL